MTSKCASLELLYEVRADVETIDGLSAHAGQDLLLEYAAAVKGRVKKIFLVHGETEVAAIFQEKLKEQGITNVEYPAWRQTVEL